jgi:diaminopimelate epimerase
MKFTKMHGAGNDYVYVDARSEDRDWPELSRQMSDRHFGVGGDGLILIKNSDVADLKMSMFNADGSEAEMCGNGIRCFVKYAVDRGIVSDSAASVSVETLAGIRQIATITENGRVTGARVSMGTPILTPKDVPVKLESAGEYGSGLVLEYPFQMDGHDLPLTFVSMGNPHAVTFIDTPVAEFPLHSVGPKIEHHAIFPNRVNFEIVNVDSREHLTARVWERGSGETLACGTGACGIAVASILGGHTGNTVDITLPGGTLKVDWDGQGEVFLEGPAEEVFSGEWT